MPYIGLWELPEGNIGQELKINDPDKNRFLTVLDGGIPDRVPNFEVLIDKSVTSGILGKETATTLGQPPIDPSEYIEIIKKIGQDLIGISFYGHTFLPNDGKGDPVAGRYPSIST